MSHLDLRQVRDSEIESTGLIYISEFNLRVTSPPDTTSVSVDALPEPRLIWKINYQEAVWTALLYTINSFFSKSFYRHLWQQIKYNKIYKKKHFGSVGVFILNTKTKLLYYYSYLWLQIIIY